jgi:hypothetical protein
MLGVEDAERIAAGAADFGTRRRPRADVRDRDVMIASGAVHAPDIYTTGGGCEKDGSWQSSDGPLGARQETKTLLVAAGQSKK